MTHSKRRKPSRPPFWSRARRHLQDNDSILAPIVGRLKREALVPRHDAFYSLARSIVGQQISVKAAQSVWTRFEATVVEVAPDSVAVVSHEQLCACGLSRQKARYLASLAEYFGNGSLCPEDWPNLDDEAIIASLTQIKGIGRWTAEMFLIFHLMRPDVLPLADIGVQRAMRDLYNDGAPLTAEEMAEIAAPWRPWRSVAVWYLWRMLDAEPVNY